MREIQLMLHEKLKETESVDLLLTESVQAGQNLRIVITVQTDATDQKLLVDLSDDRAGAAALALGHDD